MEGASVKCMELRDAMSELPGNFVERESEGVGEREIGFMESIYWKGRIWFSLIQVWWIYFCRVGFISANRHSSC